MVQGRAFAQTSGRSKSLALGLALKAICGTFVTWQNCGKPHLTMALGKLKLLSLPRNYSFSRGAAMPADRTAVAQKPADAAQEQPPKGSSGTFADIAGGIWSRTKEIGGKVVDKTKEVGGKIVEEAGPAAEKAGAAVKEGVVTGAKKVQETDKKYGVSKDVTAVAGETAEKYKKDPTKLLRDGARLAAGDVTVLAEPGIDLAKKQVRRNGSAEANRNFDKVEGTARIAAPVIGAAGDPVGAVTGAVKRQAIEGAIKDPKGTGEAAGNLGHKAMELFQSGKSKLFGKDEKDGAERSGEKAKQERASLEGAEGVAEVRSGRKGAKAEKQPEGVSEVRQKPKW